MKCKRGGKLDKTGRKVKNARMEMESENKKTNPFVSVLKSFLAIIFVLFALLAVWTIFSCIDKKNALAVIPRDYDSFVHTESAWSALSPLIDLRASDEILASDGFKQFREPFLSLRETEIRESKIVQSLLSRRVDAALYGEHFVAAVDMGVLSAVSRLGAFLPMIAKIDGLSVSRGEAGTFLLFQDKSTAIYIKPYHNLLIASNDVALFSAALKANAVYSDSEIALMSKKDSQKVRIVSNVRSLSHSMTAGSPELLAMMDTLLSEDAMSCVEIGITNDKINLKAEVPYRVQQNDALKNLLAKKSALPSLSLLLGDTVQYYTMLNFGTLAELKDAFLPFALAGQKSDAVWNRADGACRLAFSMPLDELLFSWTGKEFALLGIEGQNDPVFAIQIADETQRQSVFARVVSSILIKDSAAFILGGARLERLELPSFLNGLLQMIGIKMPAPYYMVNDGFIYFSESPETLSAVYASAKNNAKLSSEERFKVVSDGIPAEFSLSLFYNLEKSVPFFLRSKSLVSKILALYSTGRCDIALDGENLTLRLQASETQKHDSTDIAGFPIALSSRATSSLQKECGDKGSTVFWSENGRIIKSLDLKSLAVTERELPEEAFIVASAQNLRGGGVLWAVTKSGAVYLFNKKLEAVPQFPVLTGEIVSAPPVAQENSVVIPAESGALLFVDDGATAQSVPLSLNGSIKSAPAVLGDVIAVYDKSFRGQIFLLQNRTVVNAENPLSVPGIAFGAPSLFALDQKTLCAAFITQAGNLYVWQNGAFPAGFPLRLEGNFRTNVVSDGTYLYALSSDATLSRIALDGSVVQVKIPNRTVADGELCVLDGQIFVSVDGNVIYGFNADLELLAKFPLQGSGAPVFADVNGDKKKDCVVLSLDKKLCAWNVR